MWLKGAHISPNHFIMQLWELMEPMSMGTLMEAIDHAIQKKNMATKQTRQSAIAIFDRRRKADNGKSAAPVLRRPFTYPPSIARVSGRNAAQWAVTHNREILKSLWEGSIGKITTALLNVVIFFIFPIHSSPPHAFNLAANYRRHVAVQHHSRRSLLMPSIGNRTTNEPALFQPALR